MTTAERVHTDHTVTRRLGNWTTAGRFEIRTRRGQTTLDLRSPDLPAELELRLDLDHGVVKLLLPDDAVVDHRGLRWTGRGQVKDHEAPAAGTGRRVRLTGTATGGEVRVRRGGVAILTAMLTREYVADLRHAHRTGTRPTIDDPARAAVEAAGRAS